MLASVVNSRRHPLRTPPSPFLRYFSTPSDFYHQRSADCFALFAFGYLFSFHTNTNCPFCKPFVLITMRIARGGRYPSVHVLE